MTYASNDPFPPRDADVRARLSAAATWLCALNACALPWALGGESPWVQIVSAALALGAFVFAVAVGSESDARPWWRSRWAYVGACFALLVAIQSLNPSYAYESRGDEWWLVPLSPASWLPTGMHVPFDDMNGWRVLLRWAAPWFTGATLVIGLKGRRRARAVLFALAVNGLVFSLFGVFERLRGAETIYGTFAVDFRYFFGAIVYKNHAAAFLLLCSGLVGMLLLERNQKMATTPTRGSPLVFIAVCYGFLGFAMILTRSLAGLVLWCLLSATVSFGLFRARSASGKRRRARTALYGMGLLILAGVGLGCVVLAEAREAETVGVVVERRLHSVHQRQLASEQGFAMWKDRAVAGWGAGAFRYGFTRYAGREPELTRDRHLTLRWEHLHNDWLEGAIEYGALGLVLLAWAALAAVDRLRRARSGLTPAEVPAYVSCGLVLVYGLVDFPLQNGAVVMTLAVVLGVLLRRAEMRSIQKVTTTFEG